MANSYFKFKQFTVKQEKTAMKVGTDGVLLGAHAKCEDAFSILDIGTGTGLIALMMAQRSSGTIDAIEIDKNAFDEAWQNIQNSDWPDKVTVFHSSFQEYTRICLKKYQLIVSNPPFFSNSLKNEDDQKTLARHDDSLPVADLLKGVSKLLTRDGIFSVIIPATSIEEFEAEASKNKLFVNELTWIKPTPNKPVKRVIVDFSKIEGLKNESEFIIESGGRHIYSEEYKSLTKEYYLSM